MLPPWWGAGSSKQVQPSLMLFGSPVFTDPNTGHCGWLVAGYQLTVMVFSSFMYQHYQELKSPTTYDVCDVWT